MTKAPGAPANNRNAAKLPETHRINTTFKLSPEVKARLKLYKGNKSRLVDTLLRDYFETMDNL